MKKSPHAAPVFFALAICLTGCAAGGIQQGSQTHLSPTQCTDLTAIRNHQPVTRQQERSQLKALQTAGYDPGMIGFDPNYPDDYQAAQKKVDYWYRTECLHQSS
jgi:hypothetical protein